MRKFNRYFQEVCWKKKKTANLPQLPLLFVVLLLLPPSHCPFHPGQSHLIVSLFRTSPRSLGHPDFGLVPSCPWLCLVLLVGCVLVAQCAVSCVGDSGMKISTSCVTPAQPWTMSHPADSTCCWPTWSTRTRSSSSAPWRAWRMRTGRYREQNRVKERKTEMNKWRKERKEWIK